MSLMDYGRILIRRGWIIALLAFLAAASAYLFSVWQPPLYRAAQNVLIEPSRPDLGLSEAANQLLNPLVVVLDSTEVAAKIIETLELDVTPVQLREMANFAPDRLSRTIRITIDSPDVEIAAQVARAWGQHLVDFRNQRNAQAPREHRVEALLPDQPSIEQIAPQPRFAAVAGGILGVLVGAVVVFVLEFLESAIVRRREDLESFGIPVLSSIPMLNEAEVT